jgi:hypothetical protein
MTGRYCSPHGDGEKVLAGEEVAVVEINSGGTPGKNKGAAQSAGKKGSEKRRR